jgi:hypothetical protein
MIHYRERLIVSFTCFAACRAQRHKVFKVLAYAFLCIGLICALTPVGVVLWALYF